MPYLRDPQTLARPWAVPGTPGLEHRIGGLEKADVTGNVSYDPDNHDYMVRIRAQKVAGIDVPDLEVDHVEGAKLLVLGWGGTYGPITAAVKKVREGGGKVAQAHLRYLNPFPRNLGDVLHSYDSVLVPEMNLGQLLKLVRAEFLVDAAGYNKVRGLPFTSSELARRWRRCCERGQRQRARPADGEGLQDRPGVRWCPGCGDYAILAAMQSFMPELGIERERLVFVSGIGCAARFPVLHADLRDALDPRPRSGDRDRSGRVAPGLVGWVVTGDGDALSIGGNHLIHALRRNVNVKILLFNNQIYGLTKGPVLADERARAR
jgi:hypothetical protein